MKQVKKPQLVIYKSSAGAGKTFMLAFNYIDRLFSLSGKNRHREILAVTFTKKATAEMKSRIVNELSKLANGEESDYISMLKKNHVDLSDKMIKTTAENLLIDLLQDYGYFAVTTIDSFFQQIIRSFVRELNLQGAYNLELDGEQIMQKAVDDYFFNIPDNENDPQLKALKRVIDNNIDNDKNWNPKKEILKLSKEVLKESFQFNQDKVEKELEDPVSFDDYVNKLWRIKANFLNEFIFHRDEIEKILELNGLSKDDFKGGALTPIYTAEDKLYVLFAEKNITKAFINFAADAMNGLDKKDRTDSLKVKIAEDIQPHVKAIYELLTLTKGKDYLSATIILNYISLLPILKGVSQKVKDANQELNRLPISDTTAMLNELIKCSGDTPFIYDKIGTKIKYYMIDEFQDTSGMQWDNFKPLIKESLDSGGESMLVGDVKQSIYRFRNSDSDLLAINVEQDSNFKDKNKVEVLGDNWRSYKNIVMANNEIFKKLADAMQEDYNQVTGTQNSKITTIYNSLEQNPKKKDEGYVQIKAIEAKNSDELKSVEGLKHIPELINDAISRGVRPNDIAILVRENKEIKAVTQALFANGINVTSNEGMLLINAIEVRIIIDLLKLQLCPDISSYKFNLIYDYSLLNGMSIPEALAYASDNFDKKDEKLSTLSYKGESLQNYISTIIRKLELYKRESARPYLLAFEDILYQYETKYSSDIYSFLDWWGEKETEATVQLPAAPDAVQILTIHASKGLEFDVVIIPFCNWDKAAPTNPNKQGIIWVETDHQFEKDDNMSVLPIKHEPRMASSHFKEDYDAELLDCYIDNLNITYVAFTRAVKELYVYLPYKNNKKGVSYVGIGQIIYSILEKDYQQDDDILYQLGEKVEYKDDEKETTSTKVSYQDIVPEHVLNTSIKLPSRDYFHIDDDELEVKVNLGTLMHEILSRIRVQTDTEDIIAEMVMQGRLSKNDENIVRKELSDLFTFIADQDWFSDKWQILNEQSIILSDGTTRRPDRLLINQETKEAVIIDWKFGSKEHSQYNVQVTEYISLLNGMGYKTKGYLCYATLKKIVEVN